MTFCTLNLGCKVNSYESTFFKEKFLGYGFEETTLDNKPDVIIINTCSVTNQSDAKSRHMIRLARRKSENAIIVACGCSVQNHKDDLKDMGADILVGNFGKSKIPELVVDYINKKNIVKENYEINDKDFETMFVASENDKTRAFVKIQDGCNNFCSYCIIPYLRGNIRSKDINLAVEEINSLVESGHKEIVLTGIHTGSYGRDKDYDLVDLIRRISKIEKLKRIRISSIEITELNDKFLDELKNNHKICNHLHIPLQAGSDEVLNKMNRKYDTKYYLDKINAIRLIRPDISITTDLIVGFPYETDECFDKTLKLIKKIEFAKIHVFPFSLRSGTKAEEMSKYFIDEKIKKDRVKRVIELSNELESNYYKKFINKKLDIIVESSKNGKYYGHSSNYIPIYIDKPLDEGVEVSCLISDVDNLNVKGKVIDILNN